MKYNKAKNFRATGTRLTLVNKAINKASRTLKFALVKNLCNIRTFWLVNDVIRCHYIKKLCTKPTLIKKQA